MRSSFASRRIVTSRSISCYRLFHSCLARVACCSSSFSWFSSSNTCSPRSLTLLDKARTSCSNLNFSSLFVLLAPTAYSFNSWISVFSFSSCCYTFWVRCSICCRYRAFYLSYSDSLVFYIRTISFYFSRDWFMRSVMSCFSRTMSLRIWFSLSSASFSTRSRSFKAWARLSRVVSSLAANSAFCCST